MANSLRFKKEFNDFSIVTFLIENSSTFPASFSGGAIYNETFTLPPSLPTYKFLYKIRFRGAVPNYSDVAFLSTGVPAFPFFTGNRSSRKLGIRFIESMTSERPYYQDSLTNSNPSSDLSLKIPFLELQSSALILNFILLWQDSSNFTEITMSCFIDLYFAHSENDAMYFL